LIIAAINNDASGPFAINSTGTTGGTWSYYNTNSHNDNSSFEILSCPSILMASSGSVTHGWSVASITGSGIIIAAFHP
jgi:hypothetical protein